MDELDIVLLAKTNKNSEDKLTLTIGKDIFLSKCVTKLYAYPEDFGLSRWQEVKEEAEKPIIFTPIEKFVKELLDSMKTPEDYTKISSNWKAVKKEICTKLKLSIQDDHKILKELEHPKKGNDFSFETIFFVSEAIKTSGKISL